MYSSLRTPAFPAIPCETFRYPLSVGRNLIYGINKTFYARMKAGDKQSRSFRNWFRAVGAAGVDRGVKSQR